MKRSDRRPPQRRSRPSDPEPKGTGVPVILDKAAALKLLRDGPQPSFVGEDRP